MCDACVLCARPLFVLLVASTSFSMAAADCWHVLHKVSIQAFAGVAYIAYVYTVYTTWLRHLCIEQCLKYHWLCRLKDGAHLVCEQAVLASLQKVELLPLRHHGSLSRLGPFRLLSCILETYLIRKRLMLEPTPSSSMCCRCSAHVLPIAQQLLQ